MKRISKFLLTLAIGLCAIAANAATLTDSFTSTDNQVVINTSKMRWFYLGSGNQVVAAYVNGTGTSGEFAYANAGNVLYNKLINSPAVIASFVKLYGTSMYINVNTSREIYCSGNQLNVLWLPQGNGYYSDPGCAVYANIQALGN
jgi:hypothetical protein